ncbi:MAG: hypothetical protein PVJ27_05545, partial [Candidatus Brocadiaceae bacterium]
MADMRTFIHRIDARDVIEYVNDEWVEFGAENWDAESARAVVGTSLWEYVATPAVKNLLQTVVARLRQTRSRVKLPYRCDSPAARRYMEMEMEASAEGQVEFRSRTIREEEREPVYLLAQSEELATGVLLMCSWCKRVNVPPWMEVEEAVRQLELFSGPDVPGISHGLCDD